MRKSKGRGTPLNPANRFEKRSLVPDPEAEESEEPLPRTQFLKDTARSIITTNDSPD